MSKNRLSLVIALVVTVAVLAGGWFLGVQPQLAQAASNGTQQETIDATNDRNRTELERLAKANESLDSTKAELAKLQASLPSTADTDPFVESLNGFATSSGVTITSVTIGDPEQYVPVSTTPAGTATAAPSASASATPAPGSTAAPTAAATPQAADPHSDPLITSSNFSVISVTVAVDGSYDQALAFTQAAQSGARLFLVSGIAATSTDEKPPMEAQSWSLTGTIYVLADSATTPAKG
ncbi:Pilus assembly protein, PilO [Curtobacterium sp. 9128]|uniref:type 4a pilus biogenesis protein PilO n=1 Tax=Curtobacterium sp. 9128 TaxID=1793722 RepID=UPI0007D71BFC|nr:type 4a pilus biogenesis protein PilO [Curtobacterium sp. 9128]SBN61385.1 Pilus assembly protein, PilO [Curtobacterium sp. 9128]